MIHAIISVGGKDMKDLLKKVFLMSLVSSILFFVFGLLLFLQADAVIKIVSVMIGIILVGLGVVPIVNYFKTRNAGFFSSTGLLYGIFSVVAGFIILFNSDILATIIPILSGVWVIVNSVNKIQISMELRDEKVDFWIVSFIFSLLMLVVGAFLIINPLKSSLYVTQTIGIVIMVYAALDIIDTIVIKVKAKKVAKDISDSIIEVEIK